jgi:hypothetical protein
MRTSTTISSLALLLTMLSTGRAAAADDEQPVAADQRTALSLTIYQQDLALVDDRRMVKLTDGINRIAFTGVSAGLQPETVLADGLGGEPVSVLEQHYLKDLLTPTALLEAAVGHDIRIAIRNPKTGDERIEPATVLAAGGGVVLRMGDRIETTAPGRLIFDSVPSGLRAKPTLVLALMSLKAGSVPLSVSYLTTGLSWSANYIAVLDTDEAKLSLVGRASVANTSGASYPQARVALVAGALNRVTPEPVPVALARMRSPGVLMGAAAAPAPPPPPEAESLGDYHRYAFDRPVTLGERETVELPLIEAPAVPVKKEYVLAEAPSVSGIAPSEPVPVKIDVKLSFDNGKAAGLGAPLPAGIVRFYGHAGDGTKTYVGEDRLNATAVDRSVKLTMGRAFDVTAERRETSASRPADRSFEASEEITIHNAKAAPVTVTVDETLPGDWRILEESDPHERVSASAARWHLEIAAKSERKLTYHVLTRF